MKEEVNNLK